MPLQRFPGRLRPLGPPPRMPPARPPALFVTGFGTCANNRAECTHPELSGPNLRPFQGLRSS
eukprot:8124037-Alexandrium_andersonii.AAC.1